MKAGTNQVIVRIKKTIEDDLKVVKNEKGEDIQLKRYASKDTIVNDEGVTTYNPYEFVTICGEVVSVPELICHSEVVAKYEGFPQARKYNPGYVENRAPMTKANKLKRAASYYPGTHVPETITLSDMEVEVKEGDIAYFHYLCIQDQTYLKTEYNEKFEPIFQYYRIDYDQIFCVVRNKAIMPISGHVLAEPYYSEDVVDVSDGVKGKFYKDTNLVEEVFEKPAYLEARVSFIGKPLGFETCNVKPGDRIFYTTFSNFENIIEGTNYFVFRQWDIFGTNNGGVSEPVGAWTLIYPDKPKMFTPAGLYMPNNDKKPVNTGKIIHVGPNVEVDLINKNVQFEEKSSYIMKIPGKEMIFVHKEDIYVVFE